MASWPDRLLIRREKRQAERGVANRIEISVESFRLVWTGRFTSDPINSEERSWSDVASIIAFKKDCFATDQIRLAISFKSGAPAVEAVEDASGFKDFAQILPMALPGCMTFDEWFAQVAQPPFAPSTVCIYKAPA